MSEAGGDGEAHCGARQASAKRERPTAVLVASDLLAAGVLQWFYDNRLRVPSDVSVIGFDDTLAATLNRQKTILTILGFVVLALVGYYLRTARGGRELYAIGSDPDAAVLYGLPARGEADKLVDVTGVWG